MCSSERQSVKEDPSDQVADMQPLRRRGPEHFLLKVESFSESKMEKYESDEFEVGGYKWRLIFYPEGDKKRKGSNHISLYLSISDSKILTQGWEVEADFNLFVYNYVSQKYLTFKLTSETRFNWFKTESGFPQLLALDHFKETSNGYLFDDNCVFGAEVFVIGSSFVAKRQTLSMTKKINNNIFTWKVDQFSALKDECLYSDKFKNGGLQWRLSLYPKGEDRDGKHKFIAVFLNVADELTKLPANSKAYAEYKIRIRNQINNNKHIERLANYWFSNSSQAWGYLDFMALNDLNDKSKGYVVNDTLVVEIEFNVPVTTKTFI